MTDGDLPRNRLRLVKDGDAAESSRPPLDVREGAGPLAASGFDRIFDLTGQVALVVGAGAIGGAIAAALADFGARLAVADVDLDGAQRVAQACARPHTAGSMAVRLDVTDPGQVRAVVSAVEQTTERIDILVNAVGIQQRKPALEYTPGEWRRILDVNLSGAFYVAQAVGRGMVARRYGRVLTIGSVSSLLGHPHHAPYAASKGGVALLTKVLATEWAPHGVTVNALGPAYTESPLTVDLLADPATRAALISGIPMGRLGTPEDLVGAAVFLCSESARFVTGQTLYVDGGRTAD